ncbi:MAG: HTH domain-containing protein [Parcubacteria group bacterium]|nr:HTH domain-containing protein [Parcubacteria group bacterium]
MKNDRKKQILEFVKQKKEVTAKEIINHFKLTEAAIFRHLKILVERGELAKSGKTPKVFYYIPQKEEILDIELPQETKGVIEKNFINITPSGKLLEGQSAFSKWCKDRNYDPIKYSTEYVEVFNKYEKFKKNGFIDGIKKMLSTFEKTFLNNVYYLDFYSIERFGKTKLGTLLLYAKQTQNINLMDKIYTIIKDRIDNFIKIKQIKAIGFIPATINREIQFQKEMERRLNINLPKINLVKTKNMIVIPQKSLSKLKDRIENARRTIFVDDNRKFGNILLIDDAVGSGSTLNETARKIKDKKLAKNKIYGLALTGSLKGFDVISEI